MNKAEQLREKFNKGTLLRVVGAHDGLSAILVEKNGFDAIWASGLEISTSYAVPDANILTMTQYLERAVEMNDASKLPIIADCDTGFGNSNNVIYMVKRYEATGIAAVCIEDKRFPKVNSFIPGRQELATIAEFVGKIMAAKNAQSSDDFMVIARVEALIAGWGQEEALRRANAYINAGADAILIHSKSSSPKEIIDFIKAWNNKGPLIVIPTSYATITTGELSDFGISMVIYANHGIRASVKAVDSVLAKIRHLDTTYPIEDQIASLNEIFDLQGMQKMREDEESYLRVGREKIVTIIPAAGDHLEEYSMKSISLDIPIAMLDINGKPLLQRQVETLNKSGIVDIYVIGGYKRELINVDGVRIIENKDYQTSGTLHSVFCAEKHMKDRVLIVYGDILFDKEVSQRLLKSEEDITVLVDAQFDSKHYSAGKVVELVISDKAPLKTRRKINALSLSKIVKISEQISLSEAHYECPGLILLSSKGVAIFKEIFHKSKERFKNKPFHDVSKFEKASLGSLLQEIIDAGYPVYCSPVESGWIEVHSMEDYKLACSMVT